MENPTRNPFALGMVLALVSAAAFASSGSVAKSLLQGGWSPTAVVTLRVGIGALVLLGPSLWQLRGRWDLVGRNIGQVLGYGLIAVAGSQVAYFHAVQTLSIGVALMLEYLGIILIIGWLWLAHGQRPRRLTLIGVGLALAGLALLLNIVSGAQVDRVGILWGLGAAVGLAVFYISASRVRHDGLPPIPFAGLSLSVGAVTLAVLGAMGIMPWRASASDAVFGELVVPWWAAIGWLAVVTAAIAYVAGTRAARLLGSKVSGFVGLTEVMFGVLFAWLLLGELPGPVQLLGGVLILAGVIAVRLDEGRGVPASVEEPSASADTEPARPDLVTPAVVA